MKKQLKSIGLILFFALAVGNNPALSEHREDVVYLSNAFSDIINPSTGSSVINSGIISRSPDRVYTTQWHQHRIFTDYPVGCGPTAWGIVYAHWRTFHGKNNLFDGFDVTAAADWSGGTSTNRHILDAIDRIAFFTETDTVYETNKNRDSNHWTRVKYGNTKNKHICRGIAYAKENGYAHSRCWRIRGSEFKKFDHIKRYLQADRPVIAAVKVDGRGATNHFAVVEGIRLKQEKVGSNWRNRAVDYYLNNAQSGWPRKWVSARQVGINEGELWTVESIYLINISQTPLPEASDVNEEACKEWCREDGNCKMCSKLPACGPGYAQIRSFKGADKNWYACRQKGTRRAQSSEENRLNCEEWCRNDPQCVRCSTKVGCGQGYAHLKSWTGYGNNWHACRKRGESQHSRRSEEHHNDCLEWCNDNKPECWKCSKKSGCGVGFRPLKSWTGYGTNWHACAIRNRQIESDRNKSDCLQWCNSHKPECERCDVRKYCGGGYENLKSWTGSGTNWHACKKKRTRTEASRSNEQNCNDWCNNNKPECAKCSTLKYCGRGYRNLKSWTGYGKNWHACTKK